MILSSDKIQYRLVKHPTLGKCFEMHIRQFGEPVMSIELLLNLPAYIYVNLKGQFRKSDSYSKVEIKLKEKLYIELLYEIVIKNEPILCKNYEKETYDHCCEKAAEDYMRGALNCTVPYINSPTNLSVCRDSEKSGQVRHEKANKNIIIFQARNVLGSVLGKQKTTCPDPCRKITVIFGFPVIDHSGAQTGFVKFYLKSLVKQTEDFQDYTLLR